MANLSEGAVVQLSSGGQVMTIGHIDNQRSYATCYWFSEDGGFQKFSIPLVALKPASVGDDSQVDI